MSIRIPVPAAALAVLALASGPAAAQQPQQLPKCDTDAHRQFDFWIGDWEVSGGDGSQAGENTVSLILDDCVIHESWNGGAMQGQSFNIYSRTDEKWYQTWVDGIGRILRLEGGMKGDSMVMRGETKLLSGKTVLDEIAWTPLDDGRVKQHWRRSTDGGKQWQDAFIGFYAKKDGPAAGAP